MTELHEADPDGSQNAAGRVAEITRLFESIRGTLDHMITAIGIPDGHTPKTIIAKLNDLQSAHLRVLAAEEAFHDQHRNKADIDDTDYEAIRTDIGRTLDRIRASILAGDLFEGPEA